MILCYLYIRRNTAEPYSPVIFLAFYRSGFLHGLLPLGDLFGLIRNIIIFACLGVVCAYPAVRQFRNWQYMVGAILAGCIGPVSYTHLDVYKRQIMEQEQIRLDLKADITKELPFDKVDVCALFANAVDNAVEACRKLPEGARWVELKARAQKGIFAVKIANPLPEETEQTTDKTLPHTTKAYKRIRCV